MIITDAILNANSGHAVFFLLTSYMEAVGFDSKLLPQVVTKLPFTGLKDLMIRYRFIVAKLQRPPLNLDITVTAMEETAEVFWAALLRLRILEHDGRDAHMRCEQISCA